MSPAISKVNSQLSAFTFIAKSWRNEAVSANGLPLTPNSISIVGRFQFLKSLRHDNLAEYLQIERGKHGKEECPESISEFNFIHFQNERLLSANIMELHCQTSIRIYPSRSSSKYSTIVHLVCITFIQTILFITTLSPRTFWLMSGTTQNFTITVFIT